MRDRLVAILVGLTVAVVALYGIPRAYFVADLVHDSESRSVERSADLISRLLAERQNSTVPGAVTESALEPLLDPDEAIEYVSPSGETTVAGDIERTGADDISATRSIAGGGRLTVWRSGAVVADRVSDALLPLVILGAGLLLAAAVVGAWLARRLSRPFAELAAVAEDIGQGRFDVEVPHYSVPEAEAIGDALRRGAAQLDALLQRERDLAVNASHELRTPIAALRLELEDLSMWPQTPPEVAEELRRYIPELKRLSAAVTQYLDTAREQRQADTGLDG
ncbi:histidine kinase dimerization/phospho-acceptor domain-containing protein [Knoellia sp. CPCC 206450]|uniref:histidine kinase dimerization/phospho-acceptor domain-containing protein n=1 Tax=Knoellia tibetensis TaxID=3404798 RepID=UPI003B42FE08